MRSSANPSNMFNSISYSFGFINESFAKAIQEGGKFFMNEVRNLNDKRIGDISADETIFEIKIKDALTRITANPDGTLTIVKPFFGFGFYCQVIGYPVWHIICPP
jgi:hypothetical protein